MKTLLLVGFCWLAAIACAGAALVLLNGYILAPPTTHITLIIAGMQFRGRMLYVPFAILAVLAVTMARYSVWIWRNR